MSFVSPHRMPALLSKILNTTLPGYSPSSPAPSYSSTLANDEQRLEHTPRSRARQTPVGIFTKSSGSITVVLEDQEPNATCPSYGRQAAVRGTVILERSEAASEIVVEVCTMLVKLHYQGTDWRSWKGVFTSPFPKAGIKPKKFSNTLTPYGPASPRMAAVPVQARFHSHVLCLQPSVMVI